MAHHDHLPGRDALVGQKDGRQAHAHIGEDDGTEGVLLDGGKIEVGAVPRELDHLVEELVIAPGGRNVLGVQPGQVEVGL